MRASGWIVSIVAALIVLTVGYALWPTGRKPLPAEARSVTDKAVKLAALANVKKAKSASKGRSNARRAERQPKTQHPKEANEMTRFGTQPLPVIKMIVLVPAFPTVGNVPAGMIRARLVEAFGEPDLKASTVDRGYLTERYVYLAGRDRATFVLIQNGAVVETRTDNPVNP